MNALKGQNQDQTILSRNPSLKFTPILYLVQNTENILLTLRSKTIFTTTLGEFARILNVILYRLVAIKITFTFYVCYQEK